MVRFGFEIASIFSSFLPRLQAYLVPIISLIARIFGPCHKNYCNHMWSIPIVLPLQYLQRDGDEPYQDWQTEMNSQLIRVFLAMFRDNNWTFLKLRIHWVLAYDKLLGTRQFSTRPSSLLVLQGPPNSRIRRPRLPNRTRRGHYSRIILFYWKYLQYYFDKRTNDLFTSYRLYIQIWVCPIRAVINVARSWKL